MTSITPLTLLYVRPLLRLRRYLRRHHPEALEQVLNSDPMRRLSEAFISRFLSELQMLQTACFDPMMFPVQVFADDEVFKLVRRIRRGVFVDLYGQFGLLVIKSLKDL